MQPAESTTTPQKGVWTETNFVMTFFSDQVQEPRNDMTATPCSFNCKLPYS